MQFVKLFLHICTVFFYDYLAICRKKGYEKDMNIDMPTIGNRIKIRRKELGLSQTDIFEKCAISSGALSRIENGKVVPSILAFYKLSQVLECDITWLATGISLNTQNSDFNMYEEELLNGFRQLSVNEQYEILGFLSTKLCEKKRVEKKMEKSSSFIDQPQNKLA